MILTRNNLFSKTLKSHVGVNVLIPGLPDNEVLFHDLDQVYPMGKKYRVLYLLHGALEDADSWLRHTHIEDYASEHQLAVVMPSAQNSFYVNALHGLDYYDFVTEELPKFVQYMFPVSTARGDSIIAGASMGGYGATRCALGKPEAYDAFADFSGAVDPEELEPLMKKMGFDFFRYDLLFGGAERVRGSENDLYLLAERLRGSATLPKAYIYCALEDTNNYAMNQRLYHTLQTNGFDAHFADGHGQHDWAYWDRCIGDFLNTYFADQ